MTWSLSTIERARPLLGTNVAVRVHGLREQQANKAIDDAFAEVAMIHRLMSFHEPNSDVSRLNREASTGPVTVHPATFEVLRCAEMMSRSSDGAFDVTIAPELVKAGLLPPPDSTLFPDPAASWRDIELHDDQRVRFRRRLWIDLGGIAKGYAVDRALSILRDHGAIRACVNAGGDLVIFGPEAEIVHLAAPSSDALPILEVQNAAVASSGPLPDAADGTPAPHFDGRSRRSITRAFVSVVAERCIIADALTKIVLALGERSEPLLRGHQASAHLYDGAGWRHFGA